MGLSIRGSPILGATVVMLLATYVQSMPTTAPAMSASTSSLPVLPSKVPATGNGVHLMDTTPSFPYDPNTDPNCGWWWDNDGSLTCPEIVDGFGLTMDQFVKWNPSITSTCGNFVTGKSYCVYVQGGNEPSPTSTTSTGIATPTPTQAGMVENCNKFYLVKGGDGCAAVAASHGISAEQFLEWNPFTKADCSGLWPNYYVCVGLAGSNPTPSPTQPTNGVSTPTPTQAGMVGNCNKFYLVKGGDGCEAIASSHGISPAQFLAWNPFTKADCSGLWPNYHVCVGLIGGSPSPSPTQPTNGVSTPTPTQPGMVDNCDKFHKVVLGDTCASIAANNGISIEQFRQWNTGVGSDCKGMWTNAHVCVHTIGWTAPVTLNCYGNDRYLWGDNRPAARDSVGFWCDGNSSNDGSGGYNTGQVKTGCYNAPHGRGVIRIEFTVRNDNQAGTALKIDKCNEIMRRVVDRCDHGGEGNTEGWWFKAEATDKGYC